MNILNKVLGSSNSRKLKKMRRSINQVNSFEGELEQLSDQALRDKTTEFKQRLDSGESIDQLLAEAFAVVRDQTLTQADIRAYCKEHLTAYKVPKTVEFRDELPKSNVGKILRKDLRTEELNKG